MKNARGGDKSCATWCKSFAMMIRWEMPLQISSTHHQGQYTAAFLLQASMTKPCRSSPQDKSLSTASSRFMGMTSVCIPPHSPEASSLTTSSTVDMDQLLIIRNPEISMAPFEEPDFLRPPRPAIPYKPYPGSPPPDFDYRPHMPTSELVEELGVIPGDNWLHNVKGLSPVHSYTIPGLRGRMVEAPFYKYNFLPNYPKVLLL
jgi:hypothetical protein